MAAAAAISKHEAVLLEEVTYAGISGWGNSVHSGIVAHYIHAYGSEEAETALAARKWPPANSSPPSP